MKKRMTRFLSALLACCMLVTSTGLSMIANATEPQFSSTIPEGYAEANSASAWAYATDAEGKVIARRNNAGNLYANVYKTSALSATTEEGITVGLSDIASKTTSKYALVVNFTPSDAGVGYKWYVNQSLPHLFFVYKVDGSYAIVGKNTSAGYTSADAYTVYENGTLTASDSLNLNLKKVGTTYVLSYGDKSYTITDEMALWKYAKFHVGFSVMDGSQIGTDAKKVFTDSWKYIGNGHSGWDDSSVITGDNYVQFTIEEVRDAVEFTSTIPEGYAEANSASAWTYLTDAQGKVTVRRNNAGALYANVYKTAALSANNDAGVNVGLSGITSKTTSKYALVVNFTPSDAGVGYKWYVNQSLPHLFFVYKVDGSYAIVGKNTSAGYDKADAYTVYESGTLTASDSLNLNLKKVGTTYVLSYGDKSYTITDEMALWKYAKFQVGFSVMDGSQIGTDAKKVFTDSWKYIGNGHNGWDDSSVITGDNYVQFTIEEIRDAAEFTSTIPEGYAETNSASAWTYATNTEGKVTARRNNAGNLYANVYKTSALSATTEEGVTVDLSGIASKTTSKYALVVNFTPSDAGVGYKWYVNQSLPHLFFVYKVDGSYAIVGKNTSAGYTSADAYTVYESGTLTASDSLNLNLKKVGTTYVLSYGDKSYTITDEMALWKYAKFHVGFSVMDGSQIGTDAKKVFTDSWKYIGNGHSGWDDSSVITGDDYVQFTIDELTDEGNDSPVYKPDGIKAGDNFLFEQLGDDLKVTRLETAAAYERVDYNTETFSAKDNGVLLDIQNINTTSTKEYTLAVGIGGTENAWTDTATGGIILLYGSDGSVAILSAPLSVEGEVVTSTVLAYGQETFSGKLSLNIKKVRGTQNYIFDINGTPYEVDGAVIGGSDKLYFSVGVMGGFDLAADTGVVSNLQYYQNNVVDAPVEFIVKNSKPQNLGKDLGSEVAPDYITCNSTNFRFKEFEDGALQVARLTGGGAYERFVYKKPYLASGEGVTFNLEDIESESTNGYSLVFGIGAATQTVWTDKPGLMLFYGSDGSVAIIESPVTMQNNVVTSKVLAYAKTDFTGKLQLSVKLDASEENYIITVNGTPFTVDGSIINASDSINFAMGVMNGFSLNADTGVFSNLKYWESNFITSNVYYVISSIDGTVDDGVEVLPTNPEIPEYIAVTAGDGHFLFEEKEKDLLVTSTKETAAWERFVYKKTWLLTGDGATVKVDDIASRDKNYSMAFFIGGIKTGWYDSKGVMVLYSKNGNLAIVATDGLKDEKGGILTALDKAPILASEKVGWNKSVTMNLKQLKDDSYILTFNGKEYPIASEHLSGSDEMFLSVGCMNAFSLNADGTIAGLDFAGAHRTKKLTFTMREIEGVIPVDESTLDVGTKTPPEYLGVNGEDFRFKDTEEGLQVTHLAAGSAFGRVYYKHGYYSDDGIEVNVNNITSRSRQYSIVVSIAGNNAKWYDQKCLMVVYDRSGNLSLIAPSGVPTKNGGVADLNDAKVLASTKLPAFEDSLKIEVKRVDGKFNFIINGMKCTVDGKYLDDADILAFAYGVMSNYTLKDGDVSDLQFWQSNFKTKNVSFILPEIKGESAADDPLTGTPIDPDKAGFIRAGENILVYKGNDGLKVVHTAEAASWERLVYKNAFSTERTGLHFVIDDITTKAKNYSMVVKFGDGGWYDSRGYEIHYGRNGQFYIFATDGTIANPNTSPIIVSEKREALGNKMTLDVVLDGTNYRVTVNGKTYKVPAQHGKYPVVNSRQVVLGFGLMNEAKAGDINHAGVFKSNYVSFKIKETGGMIAPSDMGDPYGLIVHGNYWRLAKNSKGTQISLGRGGTGSDYVSVKKSLSTRKGGIQLDLADIKSSDSNYAMAVLLSDKEDPWSDSTGYMIVYGKSGNFSIMATDEATVTANGAKEVVSEEREKLGDKLSIDVRLSGKNYEITVNDKTYTVLAKDKTYPIQDRDNLYVSMGMLSDDKTGEFVSDGVFRKSDLTFTLDSLVHSDKEVEDDEKPEEPKDDKKEEPKEEVKPVDKPEEKKTPIVPIVVAVCAAVAGITAGTIVIVRKKKNKITEQ